LRVSERLSPRHPVTSTVGTSAAVDIGLGGTDKVLDEEEVAKEGGLRASKVT
jgi:hypothetical protein